MHQKHRAKVRLLHSAAILILKLPTGKVETVHVATYFSSTNCFWYSSYSSLVIPAALAGSEGVASSSLSPPPPKPIPDRGFPIMLFSKKAILKIAPVVLYHSEMGFFVCSFSDTLRKTAKRSCNSLANLLLDCAAKDTLISNRHKNTLTHTCTHRFASAIIWI